MKRDIIDDKGKIIGKADQGMKPIVMYTISLDGKKSSSKPLAVAKNDKK